MSKKQTILLIAIILFFDQASKIYIKTHFELGQELKVFDWFRVFFIENEGMAWGAKLSDISSYITDSTAKLFLASTILIVSVTLVFSGALGNIIDSVFYGLLFDTSSGQIASFLPEKGYSGLFYGNVVDMLYFPMFKGYFPDWVPFVGGQYFSFFDPVFNIADMAISTGVGLLLFFNKKAFSNA